VISITSAGLGVRFHKRESTERKVFMPSTAEALKVEKMPFPSPRTFEPELKTYFQTFKTDNLGQIFLTGILNVKNFNKVSVEIIQWPHTPVQMSVQVMMGKISGTTLSQLLEQFPLGTTARIHAYDVIGPDFSVVLTGAPPNTDVPIQAWVFLH
jgi:hypothetical protein